MSNNNYKIKFSIVIPSFNDHRISRTIDSILIQNYKPDYFEIVVIDKKSNKEIVNVIKKKLRGHDKIIVEDDKGIFFAINKGIKKCSYNYIYTLGTDDYITDVNFLFKIANNIYKKKSDIVFFGVNYVTKKNYIFRKWPPYKLNFFNKFIGRQFAHFGMVCTKDTYTKNNFFDTSLKPNADLNFFYSLKLDNIKISYLYFFPINMTFGGDSAKNLQTLILVNLKMLLIILRKYPLYTFGFLIKPIHKLFEVTIYKLIYKN